MSPRAAAAVPPTGPLRERLVDAAVALTLAGGWSSVTMARLAAEVGVSRQTVYNEIGTKNALAEAMVLSELGRFLAVVEAAFDAAPDDVVEALRGAVRGVLELAQDNPLLHAVVSATHGADTELLPLLTTHAGSLLGTARAVVAERIAPYALDLDDEESAVVVDLVVRTTLSHVMEPSGEPAATADGLAWMARRLLGP